ncbi:hypothetical protein K504DRAFT_271486 [Pleomassaria siparia CBS 279.74]|uniref:Uncharacterized protein n=1 Tax=Pleomassaria siparia CBS 279.74 TaxID=1314801 RepID=A0A6G1K8S7_9PLEO|nr:hypothetical protein K504DRAFT_271486 [Pleomassaria siparia CBS 279.74]
MPHTYSVSPYISRGVKRSIDRVIITYLVNRRPSCAGPYSNLSLTTKPLQQPTPQLANPLQHGASRLNISFFSLLLYSHPRMLHRQPPTL